MRDQSHAWARQSSDGAVRPRPARPAAGFADLELFATAGGGESIKIGRWEASGADSPRALAGVSPSECTVAPYRPRDERCPRAPAPAWACCGGPGGGAGRPCPGGAVAGSLDTDYRYVTGILGNDH